MTNVADLITAPTLAKVRKRLTMGPCELLRWAAAFKKAGSPVDQDPFVGGEDHLAKIESCLSGIGKQQLRARYALIDAILNDGDITAGIAAVARSTAIAWNFVRSNKVTPATSLEPSFMSALKRNQRVSELLRDAAKTNGGWSHPGVLLAGEILAAVEGDFRKPELTVRTKIMFAKDSGPNPFGILANIKIERLRAGCGMLVPDAYRCGYLWMKPEVRSSFSRGLQNALWAARNHVIRHFGDATFDFDWRWSIDLLTATDKLSAKPPQIEIEGRSAEVAFACAMIAAHPRNPDNRGGHDPLDPCVGATASIADPGNSECDDITGVTSIDVKTIVDRMEIKRLWEVVIAEDQEMGYVPTDDTRFEFLSAGTLGRAYELMVRHRRLTRAANRHLAARSGLLKRKECKPYILPEIAERVEDQVDDGGRVTKEVTLDSHALERLLQGRLYAHNRDVPEDDETPWIGNRVRIFAHSGLGKSVFVLHLQRCIAQSGLDLLPIRIGRTTSQDHPLSNIPWNSGSKQLIDEFADDPELCEAFERLALDSAVVTEQERRDWFAWMIRTGRVVFLIDALDQSAESLGKMGRFLDSGALRRCLVIATGRPEAEQGQSGVFLSREWRTLSLQPFDRERQRAYLGRELADRLLTKQIAIDLRSDADEVRRHQWKDLLEVPLLLRLLKALAASANGSKSLDNIHSRKELYDEAVRELIRKGWNSIESDRQKDVFKGKTLADAEPFVKKWLGKIAWRMVARHEFTGIINGERYQSWLADPELGADVLDALKQVALVTDSQLVEMGERDGLAFRHRSFMEYFAAWYMTATERSESDDRDDIQKPFLTDTTRDRLLHQIHETIDEDGKWLPHMMASSSNRPGDWQDTLRFSLLHADGESRDKLAAKLIELGNPWVVYQAIYRDRAPFSLPISSLARWFVHRSRTWTFDYSDAIDRVTAINVAAAARQAIFTGVIDSEKCLNRSTRDAASLASLREVVPNASTFYNSHSKVSQLRERLTELSCGDSKWNFRDSFVLVADGTFDTRKYFYGGRIDQRIHQIEAFELADFPVTNELFELFCPTHRRERDQYSNVDDQPVIYVCEWMATEFCHWLSELTGVQYRLPSEWEWEWACRWYDTRQARYWWGKNFDRQLCWCEDKLRRTRSRQEALDAFKRAENWHPSYQSLARPGLLDLSGNVWEWCADSFNPSDASPESCRFLRGGSWSNSADVCDSARRLVSSSEGRDNNVGFRLCRESISPVIPLR